MGKIQEQIFSFIAKTWRSACDARRRERTALTFIEFDGHSVSAITPARY
jgi:hypothetical protein